MRNFKFAIDNKRYYDIFYNKLKEIKKENINLIDEILKKYNYDSIIIDK